MNEDAYWIMAVEQNGKRAYTRIYQKASAETIFAMRVREALDTPPFISIKISLYWYDSQKIRHLLASMRIRSDF